VADTLSRINFDSEKEENQILEELYNLGQDDIKYNSNPLTYINIAKHQQQDKELIQKVKNDGKHYNIKSFSGAELLDTWLSIMIKLLYQRIWKQ